MILFQSNNSIQMPIAKALISAKQRGVDVAIFLKNEPPLNNAILQLLSSNKIQILVDDKKNSDATPIIIVDNKIVIIGDSLAINDLEFAEIYTKNWNQHLKTSIYIPLSVKSSAHNAFGPPTEDPGAMLKND